MAAGGFERGLLTIGMVGGGRNDNGGGKVMVKVRIMLVVMRVVMGMTEAMMVGLP